VLFVLLFSYAFGGAIHVPGVTRYIDYLLPGIIVLAIGFGASQTGVAIAEDLATGMIDRFRSLPITAAAVLAGRVAADALRNLFVAALMIAAGAAVGFRFHAGPAAALATVALAVAAGLAFSWLNLLLGLAVRDPESAGLAGLFPVIILFFTSSALAPVATMPGWLQAFAKAGPPPGQPSRPPPGSRASWPSPSRPLSPVTAMPPAPDHRQVLYVPGGNRVDAAVTSVAVAALVADGILAGLSLDKAIVQLPARQRIGVTAYAAYARAADLGNGIAFYAAIGVGAAVLTLAAFGVAAGLGAPGAVTGLLAAAAVLTLVHSAMTGRAAPAMFQIGRAGDDRAALAPLLTRFTRWSAARAAAQTTTLIVVAIALAAGT
jgi:ABC transporter DrrB family efflux protein